MIFLYLIFAAYRFVSYGAKLMGITRWKLLLEFA